MKIQLSVEMQKRFMSKNGNFNFWSTDESVYFGSARNELSHILTKQTTL